MTDDVTRARREYAKSAIAAERRAEILRTQGATPRRLAMAFEDAQLAFREAARVAENEAVADEMRRGERRCCETANSHRRK